MALKYMVLRQRWWVGFYTHSVSFGLWLIEPLADLAWLNRVVEHQANFIARRGYYVVFTDEDPGEQ